MQLNHLTMVQKKTHVSSEGGTYPQIEEIANFNAMILVCNSTNSY
jgi:hypothetical protein